MKMQLPRAEAPKVNLTALIDVVFLLLIFFMVTTQFASEGRMHVNLPEASLTPADISLSALDIVVDEKGQYWLEAQQVPEPVQENLRVELKRWQLQNPTAEVRIRADAQTAHQSVVQLLDVMGQLGISEISIATRHDKSNEQYGK